MSGAIARFAMNFVMFSAIPAKPLEMPKSWSMDAPTSPRSEVICPSCLVVLFAALSCASVNRISASVLSRLALSSSLRALRMSVADALLSASSALSFASFSATFVRASATAVCCENSPASIATPGIRPGTAA